MSSFSTAGHTTEFVEPRVGRDFKGDDIRGSQYEQVGYLVDMWADLVEGYAEKAEAFWTTFTTILSERDIPKMEQEKDYLKATGFFAPERKMWFVTRDHVTIALYLAKQGKDLYVSWRAFIKKGWSLARVAIVLFIAGVLALPLSIGFDVWSGSFSVDPVDLVLYLVLFTLILFYAIGIYGYLRGDTFGLLKGPLNELQFDDVESLSKAVHSSIIAAADRLGIDTSKLEPREPAYRERVRKSRI